MVALTAGQRPAGIELGAFVLPDAVAEDHMYVVRYTVLRALGRGRHVVDVITLIRHLRYE